MVPLRLLGGSETEARMMCWRFRSLAIAGNGACECLGWNESGSRSLLPFGAPVPCVQFGKLALASSIITDWADKSGVRDERVHR